MKKIKKNNSYETHARSGLNAELPSIETFQNQFQNYIIRIEIPEYTAICPKTKLPDFGTIEIEYQPFQSVLELKSLKTYIGSYRNLGIFYENAVNRILKDVVKDSHPHWCRVIGKFNTRGGMYSTVEASYGKIKS